MNTTTRISRLFTYGLALGMFLLTCDSVRAETPVSDVAFNARKVACDGVKLFLLMPTEVAPDEIPLTAILENCGRTDFLCGETGYLLDCNLTLRDGRGEAVPYTTSGGNLFGPGPRNHSQYALVKYERGEIRKWEYNVAK